MRYSSEKSFFSFLIFFCAFLNLKKNITITIDPIKTTKAKTRTTKKNKAFLYVFHMYIKKQPYFLLKRRIYLNNNNNNNKKKLHAIKAL